MAPGDPERDRSWVLLVWLSVLTTVIVVVWIILVYVHEERLDDYQARIEALEGAD